MFKLHDLLIYSCLSRKTLVNNAVLSMHLNKTSFYNGVFSVNIYNEYPDTS